MKCLKPLAIAAVALLAGCAINLSKLPDASIGASIIDSRSTKNEVVTVDLAGSEATLRFAGFTEADFGSSEAMKSAASMLASVGAEWRAFDIWTQEILDHHDKAIVEAKKKDEYYVRNYLTGFMHPSIIKNPRLGRFGTAVLQDPAHRYTSAEQEIIKKEFAPSCFNEQGLPLSPVDYAHKLIRNELLFSAMPRYGFDKWRQIENQLGKKMSFDDYAAHVVRTAKDDPSNYKANPESGVYNSKLQAYYPFYFETCGQATQTRYLHYVLNIHFNDLRNSLFAAVAGRVDYHEARAMVNTAIRQEVGGLNDIAKAFFEIENSGKWEHPATLPLVITRSRWTVPAHQGGMCTFFSGKESWNDSKGMDAIAAALNAGAAQLQPVSQGYHCLKWSDYNWDKVSGFVTAEADILRQFMSEYSAIKNSYQIPSWAYPGPGWESSVKVSFHESHRHQPSEKVGSASYNCADSAAGLLSFRATACNTLESLAHNFLERKTFMQNVGRENAFACANRDLLSAKTDARIYLDSCPNVFTLEGLWQGAHKQSL